MGGWQITLLCISGFSLLYNAFASERSKNDLVLQILSAAILQTILYMGGWYK